MKKLNNNKFQKLNEFKIEDLDLIRAGRWTSRTRSVGEAEWSDSALMGYSNGSGAEVSYATNSYDVLSMGTL